MTWINFVKDNLYESIETKEINTLFVKTYYQIASGSSMTKEFTKLAGGPEAVDQLDHHPLMYVFGALGCGVLYSEKLNELYAGLSHDLHVMSTKAVFTNQNISQVLVHMYQMYDHIKKKTVSHLREQYPEDYAVDVEEEEE